jgi:hypothetical protein
MYSSMHGTFCESVINWRCQEANSSDVTKKFIGNAQMKIKIAEYLLEY